MFRTLVVLGSFALAGMFSASPAKAEFIDGNTLYEWCTSKEGSATYYQDDSSCREYVLGVYDALVLSSMMMNLAFETKEERQLVCSPDRATAGQMADVVRLYLRDNPAERHQSASLLVMLAIQAAFPCPR